MELWAGCVAGALEADEFLALLGEIGFEGAEIEPTRFYDIEDARALLEGTGIDIDRVAPQIEGRLLSAFVRARKPANGA
jgi:hypothetical protein